MSSVIPGFCFQLTLVYLTDFILNHTFLLNMLYDYITVYYYRKKRKKERKKDRNITAFHWLALPLKGHL